MTESYTLETRFCACGCGGTFRALPTSKSLYLSKLHEGAKSWRELRDDQLQSKVMPPEAMLPASPEDEELEYAPV